MKESGAILPRSGPGPDCRSWNVRNPDGHPPLDPGSPISGHWSAACLYSMFVEIETRPGGSAVCSSPDSSKVCIAVGLERGPLERCQWRGQPGTRIFGFWILVELRIAPPPSPDRGASIRFPKLLKHTLLKAIHKHMQPLPEVFIAVARTLDSGFWTNPVQTPYYKPPDRVPSPDATFSWSPDSGLWILD